MVLGSHCFRAKRCLFALVATVGGVAVGMSQTEPDTYRPIPVTPPSAIQNLQPLGPKPGSDHLNLSISLPLRDQSGLKRFVDAVSNPKSGQYRKFIGPVEVGKRFGPLSATIQRVESYLTGYGMHVKLASSNGLTLLLDSTVEQAEAAFQTQINEFPPRTDVSLSERRFSFASKPVLPASIASYVLDIGGLENFTRPQPLNQVTPTQIRTLYNISPMYSAGSQGQGRTIAISSWDGYRLSNVGPEFSQFGLPTPAGGVGSNISVETIDGGSGAGSEEGEADLDIQSILGVAPLCNLVIYDGSGGDLISVLTLEANDNKADVISESYGWSLNSSTAAAAHNLHLSMSAQGITYMAASGDSGTSLNYYYPNTEPEVLSVGGSTVNVDSSGNRISEVGWSGSGGGWKATSDAFNVLPSYQTGTGVPANIPYRLVPDVALNADPNSGYLVYLQGGFYVIGGTSGASPTFAGSLGDSEQQLIANGALAVNGSGKYRLGRLQDVIYSLNGDSSVFYDVTQGGNGNLPNGSASTATAGWDFVTGWGAMNFQGFVTRLSGTGLAQFTVSPASIEGGTTSVTATVMMVTAAPAGGTAISVSGGDSTISYPSSVTIPAGSRSTTFAITTSAVSAPDTESLSATDGTTIKNAILVVNPTALSSLSFTPSSGASGSTFTGKVTLLHAAGNASGDVVALSGGDSFVSYPATVTVPVGATTATFSMTSTLTPSNDSEAITATLGTSTKSATVSLTGVAISSLTVSPVSVTGGTGVTGVVTLTNAAGTGGLTVAISGGDSSVSYPSSVTIPANGKTVSFKIATTPVSSVTSEAFSSTLASSTKSATLTVNPAALSVLSFSPTSVFGGQASLGTVTLTGPAGPNGLSVALSGGDSYVTYPSSVTVASGATTATFTVSTSVVTVNDAEALSAAVTGGTKSATLTVKPAGVVSSLTFSPTAIVGGKTSIGTIRLTGAAGPSGVVVSLTGGDSSVGYPSTVSFASGQSSGTFTVTSSIVATNDMETITATIGPSSAHATLTLDATLVSSLTFNPTSVYGGQTSQGTVTLNGPAGSSGLTVSLSGGDSSVSYPSSVTVASGATTATFTVTSSVVATNDTETLSATLFSVAKSGVLTVKPAGVVSSLSFSPAAIVGGKTSIGTIRLTGAAGPSGVVVSLTGGDSSVSYPSTVSVASGQSSGTFTVTSSMVAANDVETLTASIGPSNAHATLTIDATLVSSLVINPTSVYGGQSSQGTVTLNGPAGSSGLTVALSGGDASVSYPSSVTIASGATTVTFTVSSSTVATNDTENLIATLFSAAKSAALTVKPAGVMSSLSFSPTAIVGGKTSTATIRLTGAAGPSGVVVSLTGGDSSIGYPSTISIASGQSSATFTVTSSIVTANDAETLTATIGPSSAHAVLTVDATVVSSLGFNPTSIYGGQNSQGTVTLNGPAGSSGLTVAISGGDSSVSYPSSVTVASGSTTATFAVTSSVVATTEGETLTASLFSSSKSGVLTIKPAGVLSTISFSPTTVVGGANATGTIRLTGAAGPSGVLVNLTGGDSFASYPATVSIASGQSSGTFTVTSSAVNANDVESLTATLGPSSATGSFTITAPTLSAIVLSPTSVVGGSASLATVTLSGPAGSLGVAVTVSGGDASVAYQASLIVPAGATTATFSIATNSVTQAKTEQITAKLGAVSKVAALTIKTQ